MEEKADIIKKLAERELSDDDVAHHDLDSVKNILDTADQWEVPKAKHEQDIWENLVRKVEENDYVKQRNRILKLRIGIAACLLILGSLAYNLINPSLTEFTTPVAVTRVIQLPDGSQVTLNSSSVIAYNPDNFNESREIELNGEAFFEVKTGSTFKITTGEITTTVLGTSFNIYARNEIVEVKCMTGKVAVSNNQKEITLNPGQKIMTRSNELLKDLEEFNTKNAISWIDGKFYYDNTPFELVVNELQLQFGVKIKGTGFSGRYYSGYFDKEDLQAALKQVFVPMGYSYKVEENTVLIQ